MIRRKPLSSITTDEFIESASANDFQYHETNNINKDYSIDNLNIAWQEGSKCGKNLTISLTEQEWNTLHYHIMKYGNKNKTKWIKYHLFNAVKKETS